MEWTSEREAVRVINYRDIKDEIVYAFAYVDKSGTFQITDRNLPRVGMAVARDYNVRIQMSNANGYSAPVIEIVQARKRHASPIEIIEVWHDGVRLA